MTKILKVWTDKKFFDEFAKPSIYDRNWWYDFAPLLEYDVDYILVGGDNSISKSFSFEEQWFKWMEQGKKLVWCRNLQTEANKCVYAWEDIIDRHSEVDEYGNVKRKYAVNKDGIFSVNPYTKKLDKLLIPFVYLKSLTSSTPPIENLYAALVDEIITMDLEFKQIVMKNPVSQMQKLFDRTRAAFNLDRSIPTVLLFNPHTWESDWFTDLEFDVPIDDLVAGKNYYCMYETSTGMHVIAVIIMNTELLQAHNEKVRHQVEENTRKGIVKYELPDPDAKSIYVIKPDNLELQFNLIGENEAFSCYKYMGSSNWYIGKYKRDKSVPTYTLSMTSHLSQRDTYLKMPSVISETLGDLLDAQVFAQIHYQSVYLKTEFIKILEQIESAMDSEE